MNTKSLEVIFWLLLLSFIFNPAKWQRIRDNALFLILMLQYPIINILRIYFTPAHNYQIISSPAEYEMWIYCILGLFLATAFFDDITTRRYANVFLPLSVISTFIIATYQFHVTGITKVKLWNANVFEASLFATSIAFILFPVVIQYRKSAVVFKFLLLGSVIILSINYAGTRGIFVGQIVALTSITLLLVILEKYKLATGTVLALVTSTAIGILLNLQANGTFLGRLDVIFKLIQENGYKLIYLAITVLTALITLYYSRKKKIFSTPYVRKFSAICVIICALVFWGLDNYFMIDLTDTVKTAAQNSIARAESLDESTSNRLRLLVRAFSELDGYLLTGRGAHLEPYIATEVNGIIHFHNNYLSWLLWGGLFGLVSGLLWLLAPVFLIGKQAGSSIMIPCLSISLLWLVSLLFDSFFYWKNFTYVYVLLICMGFQISRQSAKGTT